MDDEWQSPETMPRDGKAFLATILGTVDIMWYDKGSACFRDYYHKQKINYVSAWQPLNPADTKKFKLYDISLGIYHK